MHPIPWHAADPGAALRADQPDVGAPAIGDALQRTRLGAAESERPLRDHDAHAERAARQALAIGAVARIDKLRLFGDLVADRAALATAGLRELHRLLLGGLVEGVVPRGGIEPPTHGFSVRCSTNWATWADRKGV